ncbi:MAG: hypothetical protein R2755_10545 [Acidimicrobiales bacterium]
MLTTTLRPTAGRATVLGIDVAAHPARVRAVIGLAGQYAAVDEHPHRAGEPGWWASSRTCPPSRSVAAATSRWPCSR